MLNSSVISYLSLLAVDDVTIVILWLWLGSTSDVNLSTVGPVLLDYVTIVILWLWLGSTSDVNLSTIGPVLLSAMRTLANDVKYVRIYSRW